MRCETVLSKKEQTNMKLINMSKVQTGLVLVRKRADAKDKGAHKYRMLTLKSFNPKGWLNEEGWGLSFLMACFLGGQQKGYTIH